MILILFVIKWLIDQNKLSYGENKVTFLLTLVTLTLPFFSDKIPNDILIQINHSVEMSYIEILLLDFVFGRKF